MNIWLKTTLAASLDGIGLLAALRYLRSESHGIVLTIHRVLKDEDVGSCYEPHLVTTESVFEDLLCLLHNEFEIVGLEKLVGQTDTHKRRQRIALTFDDGWVDTYSVAFPLLARYGLPATIFVCTGLIANGLPYAALPEERFARIWKHCAITERLSLLSEDLRKWGVTRPQVVGRGPWSTQLKKMSIHTRLLLLTHLEDTYNTPAPLTRQFINWDEARTMASNNITIGCHTARHCTLDCEQDATVRDELSRSRREISEQISSQVQFLAYPNGAYNSRVISIARQIGFTHAFTTNTGFLSRETSPFTIPRIAIANSLITGPSLNLNSSRTRFHLQAVYGGDRIANARFITL